jgi:hypothetical protein
MVMAENLVENQICSACGAPVRPQALFCYNCGSQVAPEIENAAGEVWSDEITDGNRAETNLLPDLSETGAPPIQKPSDTLIENEAEKNPPPQAETKLKSAAALRRSGRVAPQKKTVEVIWEEPENAPNAWFLVAAFVLALFAVGILLAMLYIR